MKVIVVHVLWWVVAVAPTLSIYIVQMYFEVFNFTISIFQCTGTSYAR